MAKDNITLKKQKQFVDSIKGGLLEMGAKIVKTEFGRTEFELDTIVGKLTISLYNQQDFLYSVYSIFENVEKAKEKFNCNPFSGKYNFHDTAKGNTAKYAIENALQHFECTLKKEVV